MMRSLVLGIAAALATSLLPVQSNFAASTDDGATLDAVLVTAKRADRTSTGATGLDLDIKDTPQSISVVSSEQMENFGADNLNDALRLATGINVEEWETNRTNYMARGFEIKNTQIDGVGLPNDWGIVTGSMDAFGYEKLEVIRGANGLLTGVGNASGTLNYVRKRPLNHRRGTLELTGGSYDHKRTEADYSTPFVESGAWAGRLVVASEDEGSYVRGLTNDRTFIYGVIDGQLGDRSTLTAGYSYQLAHTDGNMWGAVTFNNSDGTQAEFPRSASTSLDWTFWNTDYRNAFAEYTYAVSDRWDVKLSYNYRAFEDDSKLFFAYSQTGLDPETSEGLFGWPGRWFTDDEAHLLDLTASGEFDWLGETQQLILGASYSAGERETFTQPVSDTDPAFGALPAFPYSGDALPEASWGDRTLDSTFNQRLKRLYGATRLKFTEKFGAVIGFNWAEYHRDGQQSGAPFDQTERELSPYAGLTYALTDHVLAYASYSDIYQPQDQYDINDRYLDPSKGVNYEIGVKADWLDRRLLTTLAWFTAEQKSLATFAGVNGNGNYYYEGVDVDSKGVELEVQGRINEYLDVVFGFTALQLEDQQGADIYTWVPHRTLNLALTSKVPSLTELSLGVSGRWQSDIHTLDSYTGFPVRQDSYAIVNAFARWDVTPQASVRVNAANVTDEKYIGSLYQIGYYGAPRHYSVSLSYEF
jgi:outer-membrane receptor for ferric coprogen and ferric-rhodotorulic acid